MSRKLSAKKMPQGSPKPKVILPKPNDTEIILI
jgi:hypothetical protein